MRQQLIHGDNREILPVLDSESFDSIVTDPPYHLTSVVKRFGSPESAPLLGEGVGPYRRQAKGFMGRSWDGGNISFDVEFWREVYRVAKPGAYLLSFGGTRTYHRMVCAIEDAGFECKDLIIWAYGSGFPKSHNVANSIDKKLGAAGNRGAAFAAASTTQPNGTQLPPGSVLPAYEAVSDEAKEWHGWGSALKPAVEMICMARKPLSEGSIAANILKHGTGGLNIDASRIPIFDNDYEKNCAGDRGHADNRKRQSEFAMGSGRASDIGRWPANLIVDEAAAEVLDEQSGSLEAGNWTTSRLPLDPGGASRFFYCAKADRSERDFGIQGLPDRPLHWSDGDENPGSFQSDGTSRKAKNSHPTIKPLDLMRYLVRLVTRPGGLVLDPFGGSGTTGLACIAEGMDYVLIEQESEYVDIAKARLAAQQPVLGVL